MKLRRRAATCLDEVARLLGLLSDRIDPPRPPEERPSRREQHERLLSRLRHPSTGERPGTLLGVVDGVSLPGMPPQRPTEALAPVVPLQRPEPPPGAEP